MLRRLILIQFLAVGADCMLRWKEREVFHLLFQSIYVENWNAQGSHAGWLHRSCHCKLNTILSINIMAMHVNLPTDTVCVHQHATQSIFEECPLRSHNSGKTHRSCFWSVWCCWGHRQLFPMMNQGCRPVGHELQIVPCLRGDLLQAQWVFAGVSSFIRTHVHLSLRITFSAALTPGKGGLFWLCGHELNAWVSQSATGKFRAGGNSYRYQFHQRFCGIYVATSQSFS